MKHALSNGIRNKKTAILVALLFAAIGIFSRLAPHPLNFSPVAAIALFAGAYLSTVSGVLLVSVMLLVTDLILGLHFTMPFTWASFFLVMWIGRPLSGPLRPRAIAARALAGSALFFLITNFGVFVEGSLYPRSWAGLVECFRMAVPFYRNTIAGDLLYAIVFFGTYHLALRPLTTSRAVPSAPAASEGRRPAGI